MIGKFIEAYLKFVDSSEGVHYKIYNVKETTLNKIKIKIAE